MNRPLRFLLLAGAVLAACGQPPTQPAAIVCTAGQSVACVGVGGCAGGQTCKADGTGYEACVCAAQPDAGPGVDGGSGEDAGPPVDAGAPDAGPVDGGGVAVDGGPGDAGDVPDAGPFDAGAADAGSADAGAPDAGPRDAGASDGGAVTVCGSNNGGCDAYATCTDTTSGRVCTCSPGFVGDGLTCTDVNECAANNGGCSVNATCANAPGSRTCTCKAGYSGDGLSCTDVNECSTGTSGCSANATCTNTPGSRVCTCSAGWAGDGVTCTDVNECSTNNGGCSANGLCTNTAGSRTCACKAGFQGDGLSCTDINECTNGTANCNVNAACTNTAGAFTCACLAGFSGDGLTCTDINECTAGTAGCSADATCANTVGSRTCTCKPGFTGDGLTCTDINECTNGTAGCSANASCTNTPGSRLCTCLTGFTGDGFTCTDVNECATNNGGCGANATCANTVGSRTCTCATGYSGDGLTCTDVNECATNNGGCGANATCTNTAGSFSCACGAGYTGSPPSCVDVNECATNNGGCDLVNATCTNTPGSRTCACNAGFIGDGLTCAPPPPDAGTTTSEQIAYVRGQVAVGGAATATIGQALVTYLKPLVPDAGSSDMAGFFVQGDQTGPAIFVALDPATAAGGAAVNVGDRVSVVVATAGHLTGGASYPMAVLSGTVTRHSGGNAVSGLLQNVNGTDFTAPGAVDAVESEYISLAGTLFGPSVSGGQGYTNFGMVTAGTLDAGVMQLRLPVALASTEDLTAGCTVGLAAAPMWRFSSRAQPSVFASPELGAVNCPAPRLLSAIPSALATVKASFDRTLAAATVTPARFTVTQPDGGVGVTVSSATVTGPREVTLTTGAQVNGTLYSLGVSAAVTDSRGKGVDAAANSALFYGAGAGSCFPGVVISGIYGNNAGSTPFNQDFVELHNRSAAPVDLTGWSVQYASATGTSWAVAPLVGVIPPGGYYLVGLATSVGGTPLPTPDVTNTTVNMGGNSGKVALVGSTAPLSGSCPGSAYFDLVGYGGATCSEGGPTLTASPSTWAQRNDAAGATAACVDTNSNVADFVAATGAPRNTSSPTNSCTCP